MYYAAYIQIQIVNRPIFYTFDKARIIVFFPILLDFYAFKVVVGFG